MSQQTMSQNDLWNPVTNAAGQPAATPPSPSGYGEFGEPKPQPTGGIDPHLLNLLMIGGGALVALGVIVVVVLIINGGFGSTSPRTFELTSGRGQPTYVKFEKGLPVQVWVNSEHDSDVDLFVFDGSGKLVTRDEGDSKNCFVTFTPRETQTFKLLVVNRIRMEPDLMDRNRSNRCTLKWDQGKAGRS